MGKFTKYTKAILIGTLLAWLGASGAQAGYFEFAPNVGGQLTVESGGDGIVVNLFFNIESGDLSPSISMYDYDLLFDAGELSFAGVEAYLPGFAAFNPELDPLVSEGHIRITGAIFGSREILNEDVFATLKFDLVGTPAFDGLPDIELVSQFGTEGPENLRGMLLDDFETYLQFGGAAGPDVGVSPVPVPGAIWMLGSALAAMATARKVARAERA